MSTQNDQPYPEDARSGAAQQPQDNPIEAINMQLQQAEEALSELNDRAMTFVREHPGVCIAGALAVGYLVGRAASKRWLR